MPLDNRKLLTTSAIALSCALAAPAAAQTAKQTAATPADALAATTKPVASDFEVRLEPMSAKRTIRPFAGPFVLGSDRTTTFAGDVTGTASRIRAFEDTVGTSASRIRAFAGEIGGFASRIRAFYADPTISSYNPYQTAPSFWGGLYGNASSVTASASRIRAFDGNLEAYASRIRAFASRIRAFDGELLSFESAPADYQGIRTQIFTLVAATKAIYGTAVQAKTNTSFEAGFSDPMLKKWHIDLNDAGSIAGMNEVDLELFLLDWRDNAMLYSGVDSVDHWMKAVNWTPAMAHQAMGGATGVKPRVGLIDFALDAEADVKASLVLAGGHAQTGVHGAAVGSLIVAPHEGRGVMGVAPNAALYHYNPFDNTQSGSWEDVRNGLVWLSDETNIKIDATVVNLSLGVSGWTFHKDWQPVLSFGDVKNGLQDTVFVIAAGNDGITQTTHVNMKDALQNPFLVVGSVGPDGQISAFSNKPGTTCLLDGTSCNSTVRWNKATADLYKTDYLKESGLLMNRFIVAPGEFMLVDDGTGGVTRMSGTSFAAPLVAGAVALLQERWPWMIDKPRDIAHVILASARDLGVNGVADGTDPVYGRGMLDIQAAMAPLDWSRLTFKQHTSTGTKDYSFATLKATTSTERSTWQANSAYFSLFEKLQEGTRDFYIPMSSKLVGRTMGSNREQMNWYLQSRLNAALGAPTRFAGGDSSFGPRRIAAPIAGFGELAATVSMAPRTFRPGLRQGGTPFDTALALQDASGLFALRFGTGAGGAEVDGQSGFGFQSDRDIDQGGANPYLGLASGASYAAADVKLTDRLTVTAGVSADRARRDFDRLSFQERMALGRLDPYAATASVVTLGWKANEWLRATAGYTAFDEGSGLLGVQSLDGNDFAHGSTTDAATLGAEMTPGEGFSVSLSGTLGRTRAGDLDRQNLGVAAGGLFSSAFQVALSKNGLFDGRDRARVTFAQPLHVESGSLAANQVQVIDRTTGEIGSKLETFRLDSGQRTFVTEAMYGRSLLDGRGELSLFGRARLADDDTAQSALTMGGNLRLSF